MNTEHPDLVVEENETLNLSPDSKRFKHVVQTERPQSIAEVRKILGPSVKAASTTKSHGPCCTIPDELQSTLISSEDLESSDDQTRFRALGLSYKAAREYVRTTDASSLAHWEPVLDKFIQLNKAILNQFFFNDIDVYNGATLNIATNAHAINAMRIRLHGTGKIVCKGPTTFRALSFERILKVALNPGFFNQNLGSVQNKP
jgi:hypothetical protein